MLKLEVSHWLFPSISGLMLRLNKKRGWRLILGRIYLPRYWLA